MSEELFEEVKGVIINSVASNLSADELIPEFQLAGNILDSMAVTNLILALEEHFGFSFEDDDLTAEAFETVNSLAELVNQKV